MAIALALAITGPAEAARFRTVYAATSGSLDPEIGATGNGALYVVDPIHGTYGQGAVFALKGRTLNLLYSFTGFSIRYAFSGSGDGWQPNGPLLLARNGVFYGTTVGGGTGEGSSGYGTVFSITSSGAFTTVHAFRGRRDGAYPTGGLEQAGDGKIYGGTQSGTIFAITP
jgi:uncharacterized repeat protein (TIGR03803 family)